MTREINPFLPGVDTDRSAEERNYIQQDGRSALHRFIYDRIKLLNLLEGLTCRMAAAERGMQSSVLLRCKSWWDSSLATTGCMCARLTA